jgi:translocator protein
VLHLKGAAMTKYLSYLTLVVFLALVLGVAFFGAQYQPGEWYEHLNKPLWTPPNWLFPPVWSVLYLMIAVAGWLIFSSNNKMLKVLWVSQLILNGLWSWLFFGIHSQGGGLADILAMLACISAMVLMSFKLSKYVFRILLPYLFWVGYASALNFAIYISNSG